MHANIFMPSSTHKLFQFSEALYNLAKASRRRCSLFPFVSLLPALLQLLQYEIWEDLWGGGGILKNL
jgi:hypothetical protein